MPLGIWTLWERPNLMMMHYWVTLRIGGFNVKRVIIDQGSGTEIMYQTCIEDWSSKMTTSLNMILPLVGINGKVVTLTG